MVYPQLVFQIHSVPIKLTMRKNKMKIMGWILSQNDLQMHAQLSMNLINVADMFYYSQPNAFQIVCQGSVISV